MLKNIFNTSIFIIQHILQRKTKILKRPTLNSYSYNNENIKTFFIVHQIIAQHRTYILVTKQETKNKALKRKITNKQPNYEFKKFDSLNDHLTSDFDL